MKIALGQVFDFMSGKFGTDTSILTVPSATTTPIGAALSDQLIISGSATITAFDVAAAGVVRAVTFSGACTLTYNATSLILPGSASIVSAAGDNAIFRSLGGGAWRCVDYETASGYPVVSNPNPNNVTSINGGPLAGMRNRIINGDMRIDQRNNGAAVAPTAGSSYTLDRYFLNATVASKLTFQQVADAPAGFKFSTKITVAAQYAPAAADQFQYAQGIEGQNIVDFQLGTAGAATITLSNQIKGSVAGTYAVAIRNGAANRSYVGTIAVTTAWAPVKITLVGDITGTWLTDNGAGIYLSFDLGSGANFTTAANTWQAGNFTRTAGSVTFVNQAAGSSLNITGVQCELGPVATPFEQRPISYELAACQRYYYTARIDVEGFSTAVGQQIGTRISFPVRMRATPTSLLSRVTSGAGIAATSSGATVTVDGLTSFAISTGVTNTISFVDDLTASAEL